MGKVRGEVEDAAVNPVTEAGMPHVLLIIAENVAPLRL